MSETLDPRVPSNGLSTDLPDELSRRIPLALGAAAFGTLFCIVAWIVNSDIFFRSFLSAWLFFLGISLGCMGILFLHHTIGGTWGLLVRRIGEAAMLALPVLAVLFIVVCLGIGTLYPWAIPTELAQDPVLRVKHAWYFTTWFFILRAVIYFAGWFGLMWVIRVTSLAQDRRPEPWQIVRLNRVGAGGSVAYVVLMTLAGVDWIMSREPHWFSTVFGFIQVVGQGLSGIAFMILVLSLLIHRQPFASWHRKDLLNDLGNIMLMFVVLWAYMSLAQLLVIWMGNIQQDITWYITRTTGGWRVVSGVLIGLHFFVPFYLLLFRGVKRRAAVMGLLCACVLPLRFVDIIYWVLPGGPDHREPLNAANCLNAFWMLISSWLCVGGFWATAFLWNFRSAPPMPLLAATAEAELEHAHG